jgi:hypothetical protein
MPTTDCAIDISEDSKSGSAQRESQGASGLLRGLFFGFAVTTTIGLALASWYVGVRILAADAPAPPRAAEPLAATQNSTAEAFRYTVPAALLFLQVAGLGPKQDARFVRSLQSDGFRAQVEAQDATARILIGPFSTRAELEQAQRKLQSAGILAVEAAH